MLGHSISTTMAIPLDPKQLVTFEELLMSQVVSQDALIRLLIAKGLFSKEEFLEMVRLVDQETKLKRKLESGVEV
jgi:hypothetical protein